MPIHPVPYAPTPTPAPATLREYQVTLMYERAPARNIRVGVSQVVLDRGTPAGLMEMRARLDGTLRAMASLDGPRNAADLLNYWLQVIPLEDGQAKGNPFAWHPSWDQAA